MLIRRFPLIALAVTWALSVAFAQSPDRPADQAFQNILVLKGKPASQVRPIMDEFGHALGVECAFCHDPDHLESDAKPQFATARDMYRMVDGIGGGLLASRGGLTCWTCHRGQSKPSRFPSAELDELQAKWPADLAGSPDALKLTMTVYARSLGVTCDFCHVAGDWKSHAKPAMVTMTTMLAIFDELPKYSKAAANRSQCWMCHQGSRSPERHPVGTVTGESR
jgi:hypothetical protein